MSELSDFCMSEAPDFCPLGLLSGAALGAWPVVSRFISEAPDFCPALDLSSLDRLLALSFAWLAFGPFSSWALPLGAGCELAAGDCCDCAGFCATASVGPARRAATAADASKTILMGGSSGCHFAPLSRLRNQRPSVWRVPVSPAPG